MRLNPEVLSILDDPNSVEQPEAFYRMAWTRAYLKKTGLLENPALKMSTLSEQGRTTDHVDSDEIVRHIRFGIDTDAVSAEVAEHVADELVLAP